MAVRKEKIDKRVRNQVYRRDNHTCRYCGRKDGPFHCDHVYPESKGGETTADNLVTACSDCNRKKYNHVGIWPKPVGYFDEHPNERAVPLVTPQPPRIRRPVTRSTPVAAAPTVARSRQETKLPAWLVRIALLGFLFFAIGVSGLFFVFLSEYIAGVRFYRDVYVVLIGFAVFGFAAASPIWGLVGKE